VSERFVPAVDSPAADDGAAWWFAFRDGELLVAEPPTGGAAVPLVPDLATFGPEPVRRQYLGTLDGRPAWSAEFDVAVEAPAGFAFRGLRELHGRLHETVWAVAGRAVQIVAWDRDHAFCGRCGTGTERTPGERARRCPVCGLTAFPRVSPAIIVLIERGEAILLARGHRTPPGRFGIVAGFVEAGESLEDAVRREVREEVGLEIADLRYFGSQPWPFPHGIMIGFTARHATGEVAPDPAELVEAGWYTFDQLPRVPPKLSIARRLIDAWAARQGRTIADEW
jgi:NAD+ diphosphatase